MDEVGKSLTILTTIIVGFMIAAYILHIAISIRGFAEDLRYIKMELQRCSDRMRPKWRRRRRRLWLRLLIPFYRW